jgi:hypothetical protein
MTDRAAILNQLSTGQITATDAARLLNGEPKAEAPRPIANANKRWLHVRVSDLETGRNRVNVNVPLTWVEVGLKIGAKHKPEISGIDFNEIVDMIREGASGKIVEVEDVNEGERVEIFVD